MRGSSDQLTPSTPSTPSTTSTMTTDEPIEVRRGLVAGMEAPAQFLWRDRLWLVRDVQAWPVDPGGAEVWRVLAANGREGQHGVYELAQASSTSQWRLRTVG
jgi:hypothetical protein